MLLAHEAWYDDDDTSLFSSEMATFGSCAVLDMRYIHALATYEQYVTVVYVLRSLARKDVVCVPVLRSSERL
jgi:hypothetical protein